MANSTWVVDVAQADFERDVIQRSRELPVVVDFWAPWCGPCVMLSPILEKLAEENQGAFVLAKVNIDEAQELAAHYAVEAIPAVQAFRDGKPVLGFVGVLPENQLREFVERIRPTQADQWTHQAADLETVNPPQAEALYRRVLEQQPNDEAAVVGLARVLVTAGKDDEARQVLDQTGPGGEFGPEVERLEGILFLRQAAKEMGKEEDLRRRLESDPKNAQLRYELGCVTAAAGRYKEALDLLLSAADEDRKLAASKVRQVMVKIFQLIGARDPVSDEYRDKLTRLLY